MREATLYETQEGKTLRCTACRQFCGVNDTQTGLCGVRQNLDGKLYLLVYGKAASAGIDPIEKKPLHHFLPGSPIFSLGTVGCNFTCTFCQNWQISQAPKELRLRSLREKKPGLMQEEIGKLGYELPPERIVEICLEKGVESIAFTYNEPAIFVEYAHDTMELAAKHGIRGVFVSSGYESEEAMEYMDGFLHAMNLDLKSFSDSFYKKFCSAELEQVLNTLQDAHKRGIWLEITTLIIPGKNDSDDELRQIAEFIASLSQDIPWHISAFSPRYQMKDVPQTDRKSLERAYQIGKDAGLHHVYLGNVLDEERNSTFCPECGEVLVRRRGYSTGILNMEKGRCGKCSAEIAGVWK